MRSLDKWRNRASAKGQHPFELKIIRTRGYDLWVRQTERAQNTRFSLSDREDMARLMANSYVRMFVQHSGASVPRAYFRYDDLYFEAADPRTLGDMVDWTIQQAKQTNDQVIYITLLVELKDRLVLLFKAAPPPFKGTEVEFLGRITRALEELVAST